MEGGDERDVGGGARRADVMMTDGLGFLVLGFNV